MKKKNFVAKIKKIRFGCATCAVVSVLIIFYLPFYLSILIQWVNLCIEYSQTSNEQTNEKKERRLCVVNVMHFSNFLIFRVFNMIFWWIFFIPFLVYYRVCFIQMEKFWFSGSINQFVEITTFQLKFEMEKKRTGK